MYSWQCSRLRTNIDTSLDCMPSDGPRKKPESSFLSSESDPGNTSIMSTWVSGSQRSKSDRSANKACPVAVKCSAILWYSVVRGQQSESNIECSISDLFGLSSNRTEFTLIDLVHDEAINVFGLSVGGSTKPKAPRVAHRKSHCKLAVSCNLACESCHVHSVEGMHLHVGAE